MRTREEMRSDRRNQTIIAAALPPNYFQGIADEDTHKQNVLARRRAKNKVARKSRRKNR